ncbi:MAG: UpxY family transcription antiterminator [Muribaculaceae bacterium]|nr:UpxY family transcription antiterminator [Muribaculaceae bacterium]MDE6134475.1 UpxY family transcription antiterminator [Muribaculaceae bacterium]
MRDLRRRNANVLAIHELEKAGLEVFTPMTQMIMTIGGRRQRREVPVIQDLLFVHEVKAELDRVVARYPNLQYRYQLGKSIHDPAVIRDDDMTRFIKAVTAMGNPIYYKPGELKKSMYGKKIRIVGGLLDSIEGHLLSVKGLRKRRVIVEIPNMIAASVEVSPEFIMFV